VEEEGAEGVDRRQRADGKEEKVKRVCTHEACGECYKDMRGVDLCREDLHLRIE
jgi:hypothetical protein